MVETGCPSSLLRRSLRAFDIAAIVVGCVVGAGIFIVPGQVAAGASSAGVILGLWIAAGLVCLLGALSLAELAGAMPGAGGVYTFLRAAFGDRVGFLYGWATAIAINPSIIAALAVAAASHCLAVFSLTAVERTSVSVVCIATFAALNCRGLQAARWTQILFTVAKVAGLAVIALAVLTRRGLLALDKGSPPFGWSDLNGIRAALVAILWTFDGWTYAAFSGAEAKTPSRALPRGLMFGIGICIAVYLVVNIAYHSALTIEQVRTSERVAESAVAAVRGAAAGRVVSVLIVVAILGSLNAMFLTAPRGLLAMAEDGLSIPVLAAVHTRWRTPVVAILLQAGLASAYMLLGTFDELLAVTVAMNWLFHGAVMIAVIVLRRRRPKLARPFSTPLFPLTPLVFCCVAGCVVVAAVASAPRHAALGALLLAAGLLVFPLVRHPR